jgi:hypothetical protein
MRYVKRLSGEPGEIETAHDALPDGQVISSQVRERSLRRMLSNGDDGRMGAAGNVAHLLMRLFVTKEGQMRPKTRMLTTPDRGVYTVVPTFISSS